MNKEFKVIYNKNYINVDELIGEKWKDDYKVYIQKVYDKTFVTFRGSNGFVHFNDSHSIYVNEFYGKKETFLEMIEIAERYGW